MGTKTYSETLFLDQSRENIFLFPCNFVWWHKVEEHNDIKQILMDAIDKDLETKEHLYKNNPTWFCDVTSSFHKTKDGGKLIDDQTNNIFSKILWDYFDKMLITLLDSIVPIRSPKASSVYHIWYNRYQKGDWQEIHDHAGSNFSGIYFVDVSKDNSGPAFYQQQLNLSCHDMHQKHVGSKNVEGYIMIFPSELSHYVDPSIDFRTTISFNIRCEYN